MYTKTLLSVFSLVVFIKVVCAKPWTICAGTHIINGLNVFNCSGKDHFEISKENEDVIPDNAEVIDFTKNRITVLPEFSESKPCGDNPCSKLVNSSEFNCVVELLFARNEIRSFHKQAFKNLRCLKKLDLSYNEISFNSQEFDIRTFQHGLAHLEFLNLRGNPLGILPDNLISTAFMSHLQELDLSHCSLSTLGENAVDDFAELKILNLSFNGLEKLEKGTFKGLTRLNILNLQQNKLSHLPDKIFGDLTALITINLADNLVKSFHPFAFYSDSSLQNLYLQRNSLKSIPYIAIDRLPKLKLLDLSRNPISEVLSNPNVNSVENLTLDSLVGLKSLGRNALASFPNLQSLSISNNKILTQIDRQFLGDTVSKLKIVKLSNNGLTTLDRNALPWQQLDDLDLSGNPWLCDFSLGWMITADSIAEGTVFCQEPTNLKGQDIKSLSNKDLARTIPIAPIGALIAGLALLPVIGILGYCLWKRRRFFKCFSLKVKGQYVSVFTRDMDADGEQRVAIELKVNVDRLKTVSKGDDDDTKPFITHEDGRVGDEQNHV